MIVISDTSPLNYLILVGHAELLPRLFGEVLIPQIVLDELGGSGAPSEILDWLSSIPEWLKIKEAKSAATIDLTHLDPGERDAILLAKEVSADLVLLDDRRARIAAKQLGLSITGTIGILDKAARAGLINVREVVKKLTETDFYISGNSYKICFTINRTSSYASD